MADKVRELAAKQGEAIAHELGCRGPGGLLSVLAEDGISKICERILQAELKPLLDKWQAFKPHVWESSFADKDYEHTDYTRALMALAEEIEGLGNPTRRKQ